MLLNRIEINNFGPYIGRHSVDLSVEGGAPIILIHGENERGKTSFANAVRWCLYGRARGRKGRALATTSLMNSEALDAGAFNMTVTLEFEHEGKDYKLIRHVQSKVRPASDRDLEPVLTLEVAGHVQPRERVSDIINGILHPDISRFFLFDGEMLGDFEDLLNDPDRAPALVRDSIEQILGLPALQRGEKDLEELWQQAERKQLGEAKKSKENEKLVRDAQQKEEELAAISRDIAENVELKRNLDSQRIELKDLRERFAEIQAEVKQLDLREAELAEVQTEAEETRVRSRELLRDVWWLPLSEKIRNEYNLSEAVDKGERERLREVVQARGQVDAIGKSVGTGACSVCGQPVGAEVREGLRTQQSRLEAALQALESKEREVRGARERAHALRPFLLGGDVEALGTLEMGLRRARMRHGRIKRQIDEMKQRIRAHDRAEVQRVEREYDACVLRHREVTDLLTTGLERRIGIQGSLERLRQRIRSLPLADKRLVAEALLLGALQALFKRGIDSFRERVKRDVEEEATRVHQSLTNEPEYERLRITPQYGLVLTNKEGRTIHSRSAGSEQILALSLIGALNRCATREAPVVMDTPFGRLDAGHRANILKFAPSFGRQVVLLVQSGEFDRERDMEYVATKVAREYRIRRDGASDRSVIEPVITT